MDISLHNVIWINILNIIIGHWNNIGVKPEQFQLFYPTPVCIYIYMHNIIYIKVFSMNIMKCITFVERPQPLERTAKYNLY